jgi:hypothetical protein
MDCWITGLMRVAGRWMLDAAVEPQYESTSIKHQATGNNPPIH